MSSKSTFNQPDWEVSGDVYNTAGDLILTKDSSKADLERALSSLRHDIAALSGLDDSRRETALRDLDGAIEDARKPQTNKESLSQRLKSLAETLDGGAGASRSALKLAKTVVAIAKWVALVL